MEKSKWTLERVKSYLIKLDEKTKLNISERLIVEINPRLKTTWARVIGKKKRGTVGYQSLNMQFSQNLINFGNDEQIEDTIIHEYAHCMQAVKGEKMSHSAKFKSYCKKLGGSGETYATEKLAYAPKQDCRKTKKRYEVKCSSCHRVYVYFKRTSLIQAIENKRSHGYQCVCGNDHFSYSLQLVENQENSHQN